MDEKELTEMTNKELGDPERIKSTRIINAAIIGFLIGIIFYSVVKNSWGFLTLIPLFLIYKLLNKSKRSKDDDL